MTPNTGTWLTQEAHDRLQGELEQLQGPKRSEITQRIAAARDEGDLKENGAYHAAREEQGKLEARVNELTELLRNATVGQIPPDDGVVEQGMYVKITMGDRQIGFLLGNREVAGDSEIQVFSDQSPLGGAIQGSKVGDTVDFVAPSGKTQTVKIVSAEPYRIP